MPRFVILEHDYPELHWDLMLEAGAALRTWRLAAPPQVLGERIAATALPDHRLHYLDYEGPISGGRGTVKRWDAGSYEEDTASSPGSELRLRLTGAMLCGDARLTHIMGDRWACVWNG